MYFSLEHRAMLAEISLGYDSGKGVLQWLYSLAIPSDIRLKGIKWSVSQQVHKKKNNLHNSIFPRTSYLLQYDWIMFSPDLSISTVCSHIIVHLSVNVTLRRYAKTAIKKYTPAATRPCHSHLIPR